MKAIALEELEIRLTALVVPGVTENRIWCEGAGLRKARQTMKNPPTQRHKVRRRVEATRAPNLPRAR